MNKQLATKDLDKNLQWNTSVGDKLLRESITEVGLKNGDPNLNEGWNCYITNVEKIHHYSYIILRPQAGTYRGPRHPERINEFKESVKQIVEKYHL